MKFQAMYEQSDPVQLSALARRARMALLLVPGGDGRDLAGWTNAAPVGEGFMVHLAVDDPQAKAVRAGGAATLCFSEILATIPSDWVDPEDASRATNLYLHAEYSCAVHPLEASGPKGLEALAELMRAFQPQGGYRDPGTHADFYAPKARGLVVARLDVLSRRSKWKVGQVWPVPLRRVIVAKLRERARPEDLRSALEMEAWMAAHPG